VWRPSWSSRCRSPVPGPGPGEIRIRVAAAGVNPIDWKLRSGAGREVLPVDLPAIPGREAVVDRMGEGVQGVSVGDRVFGLGGLTGATAESAVLSAWAHAPATWTFLHRQHIVRDELAGVLALGVQRVGGHHDTSHVHGGQQRLETGDLVGLSSISRWATTIPLSWGIAARRCTPPCPVSSQVPRSVLPSTAIVRTRSSCR